MMSVDRVAPDLTAIRARCEAATPGPWWATENLDEGPGAAIGVATGDNIEGVTTIVVTPGNGSCDVGDSDRYEPDAEFIAHCREDIPELLDECERWRRIARAYRDGETPSPDDWPELKAFLAASRSAPDATAAPDDMESLRSALGSEAL